MSGVTTFGSYVRALRKARRISIANLAKELRQRGVPKRIVSRCILIDIELDRRQPPRELCHALREYFNVNEDYLLYLAGYLPRRMVERGLKPQEVVRMYIHAERGAFVRALRESKEWRQYKTALYLGRPAT